MDSRSHFFELNAYPHPAFAAPAPASPVFTTHKASRPQMERKQWDENGGQLVKMTQNQMEPTSEDHGSPQLMKSFKLVEKRSNYKDGELRSTSLSWSSERRCQVEGCNSALVGAKEYHKKHKVCESHSKATKVVVKGIEQRFCQQCSRFHVVSEFDGAKRSCRRKLACHNKRRRKSFFGTSVTISSKSQFGRALSPLSPTSDSKMFSSSWADMFPIPKTDITELTSEKQAPLYLTEPYLLSQKIRSWPHANGIGNHNVGSQLINRTFLEGAHESLPCANIGSWDLLQVPDTFDLSCVSKLK